MISPTEQLIYMDAARIVQTHYGNTQPTPAGVDIEAANLRARWDIPEDQARAIIKEVLI